MIEMGKIGDLVTVHWPMKPGCEQNGDNVFF